MTRAPEPATAQDLRAANLAVFRDRFPALADKLEAIADPVSHLVWRDGAAINIDLGSGMLYPRDAAEVAAEQVAAVKDKPKRVFLNAPSGVSLQSTVTINLATAMMNELRQREITSLPTHPLIPSGALMVFGIGLGLHIEPLVEQVESPAVVLIEHTLEFLHHSLSVIDWAALTARLDEQGRKLFILYAARLDQLNTLMNRTLSASNMPFLDGSTVVMHYRSWVLQEAYDQFSRDLTHLFISKGFFEDEVVMMTNSAGNFTRNRWHLVEPQQVVPRAEPVFIVGSGPSIDKDIAHLRRWREHAIVLSAGTGLRVLLRNGIRPDFHCELENHQLSDDILRDLDAEHGLSGIRLIASCTVWPRMAELFDDAYFFFRPAVSSTLTFGRGYKVVHGSVPTCSNTAFAAAVALGFRDIYLFGVDCGSKDANNHHSRDSIYFDDKNPMGFKNTLKPHARPGNFGGFVSSNWVLEWTRDFLEHAAAACKGNFYNCSDGAKIVGFTPKVARAIDFRHAPLDRTAVIAAATRSLRHFAPAAFFAEYDLAALIQQFDDFTAETDTLEAELLDDCTTMPAFDAAISAFAARLAEDCRGPLAMLGSSLSNNSSIGYFYVHRLETEALRADLYAVFARAYIAELRRMTAEGRDLMEKLLQDAQAVLAEIA